MTVTVKLVIAFVLVKVERTLVMSAEMEEIKRVYGSKKIEIIRRLREFEQLGLKGNDEEIFTELAFCILTPQSKAKVCWSAIVNLKGRDLLLNGNTLQIRQGLVGVRFKNKKAGYIVKMRKFFTSNGKLCIKPALKGFDNIYECREWLVKNITGIGYKEASHFLRNIGLGDEITILDRHILRNLFRLSVIKEIPKSITRSRYIHIETAMKDFAKRIDIPVPHLDLVFWCKETGEIFK